MKKTLSTAFIVAALALTSACGGGGDDRPSKGELTATITKASNGELTKKQADCAATVILDSDLSDEAITAVAEGDTDYKPSADDSKAQEKATPELVKCLTPATPDPEASEAPATPDAPAATE